MFMFGWEAVHEPHEVAGEEEDGPTPDPPFRGRPFGETVYFIFAYFVFASLCLVLFFISRSVQSIHSYSKRGNSVCTIQSAKEGVIRVRKG